MDYVTKFVWVPPGLFDPPMAELLPVHGSLVLVFSLHRPQLNATFIVVGEKACVSLYSMPHA